MCVLAGIEGTRGKAACWLFWFLLCAFIPLQGHTIILVSYNLALSIVDFYACSKCGVCVYGVHKQVYIYLFYFCYYADHCRLIACDLPLCRNPIRRPGDCCPTCPPAPRPPPTPTLPTAPPTLPPPPPIPPSEF